MTHGSDIAAPSTPAHRRRGRYQQALGRLGGAQKSQAGVPLYTRYVNRRLGRYAAAVGYTAGLTPNQVTMLSGLCSALAITLLVLVSPAGWLAVVVTVLLVAGYALDSADGQLARLTGTGGPAGEWLDHVVDAARTPALHLAVLVSMYRFTDLPDWVLLLPILFVLTATVRFFSQILAEQLRRQAESTVADAAPTGGGQAHGGPSQGGASQAGASQAGASQGAPSPSGQLGRSIVQTPSDTGVINLVFVFLAWPTVFAWGYGILLGCNAMLALVSLMRRFGELKPA